MDALRRSLLQGLIGGTALTVGGGLIYAAPEVARLAAANLDASARPPLAGAVAPAIPGVERRAPTAPAQAVTQPPPSDRDLWAAFSPYERHSTIGLGWKIADLTAPSAGAMTLALIRQNGRMATVRVHANTGLPRGVASSRDFDFFLLNGADGDTPTDEKLGRVLLTLARTITGSTEPIAGLAPYNAARAAGVVL